MREQGIAQRVLRCLLERHRSALVPSGVEGGVIADRGARGGNVTIVAGPLAGWQRDTDLRPQDR